MTDRSSYFRMDRQDLARLVPADLLRRLSEFVGAADESGWGRLCKDQKSAIMFDVGGWTVECRPVKTELEEAREEISSLKRRVAELEAKR